MNIHNHCNKCTCESLAVFVLCWTTVSCTCSRTTCTAAHVKSVNQTTFNNTSLIINQGTWKNPRWKMDRFLIMLIRTGGGGNKSSSFTGKGKNGKNLKKKKKTVLKEGTVKNWGKDWIQIDQKDSKLVIHCVACIKASWEPKCQMQELYNVRSIHKGDI